MPFSFQRMKSNEIYKGRVFTITVDTVELPDGRSAEREIVHHNGGVCVLALTEDGNVPLVRQFRHGADKEMLELPAGKLELGESPEACGRRELAEECGLNADSFVSLGRIYPTPAYCGEIIHIFLAKGLTETEKNPDEDEFLSVEYVSLNKLRGMCRSGEIEDAKTVAAVFRAEV
ncbi:MAG: NUDIX hydrolase [Oscillospiraceae bacterium]|nr:NUDIX hydrolase [Oscillospiraceae bacterium]